MNPITAIELPKGSAGTESSAAIVVFALTALRALLAPCMILLATVEAPRWALGSCLLVAFLSDIYDGVIARRFGVATPALRRFDSITDTVFYLAVVYVAWMRYPAALRSNLVGISLLIALEMTRYLYDLIKFGREASYHMWSAKVWGLSLFVSFFVLFTFGTAALLPVAIVLGVAAEIEGLMACIILPKWTHDVPSIFHAWCLARGAHLVR